MPLRPGSPRRHGTPRGERRASGEGARCRRRRRGGLRSCKGSRATGLGARRAGGGGEGRAPAAASRRRRRRLSRQEPERNERFGAVRPKRRARVRRSTADFVFSCAATCGFGGYSTAEGPFQFSAVALSFSQLFASPVLRRPFGSF